MSNLFSINGKKMHKIKQLGAGMVGVTWLVSDNGTKYALKLQKLINKEKNYGNEIWRELDFYKAIKKFTSSEREFFTQLYDYEISNNCQFKHKRPFKSIGDQLKYEKKLDKSKYCIKFLTKYIDGDTLESYILNNKISTAKKKSLLTQIVNIIMILYKYGYSHNDLHPGNIMVVKTTDKYFSFMKKKVPTYGIRLIAIDYGEVVHGKFVKYAIKDKPYLKFFKNKDRWLFYELYYSILGSGLLMPTINLIDDCRKKKEKLPWEKGKYASRNYALENIEKNYKSFFKSRLKKYSKIHGIEMYDYYIENGTFLDYRNPNYERQIVKNTILEEFSLLYPKEYKKYIGWCTVRKIDFPKTTFIKFLEAKNYKDIIKICKEWY